MPTYKKMEDHINIMYVPEHYSGYENPYVTVTIKRGEYDEMQVNMLKSCIEEALLKFGTISKKPFKAEIKP